MQAAQVGFADVDVLWGCVCVELLVPLLQEVLLYALQAQSKFSYDAAAIFDRSSAIHLAALKTCLCSMQAFRLVDLSHVPIALRPLSEMQEP